MPTRREAMAAGVGALLGGPAAAEAAYKAQQDKLRAKMFMAWLNSPQFLRVHRRFVPSFPIPLTDFRVWRPRLTVTLRH